MSTLALAKGELGSRIAQLSRLTGFNLKDTAIGPDVTFLDWVESLGREGLRVDGKPFTLANRPALRFLYAQIPSTPVETFKKTLVLQKGAQCGATVLAMLASIYFALKFPGITAASYVPDATLARFFSAHRLLPLIRQIPAAYERLLEDSALEDVGAHARKGEGNQMVRVLGSSKLLSTYTTGRVSTEAVPVDFLLVDEVQGMSPATIEKISERMSASSFRWTFLLSTANFEGGDINHFYRRGTQHRFHTHCGCDGGVILDDVFPACVVYDEGADDYCYACPVCHTRIAEPQQGVWVPDNPDADFVSVHFPQTLSPTISPRDLITAYQNATDPANFWRRKMGRPFRDPSQQPVDQAVLDRCVAAGRVAGVVWEKSGRDLYMGVDNMGGLSCVVIKRRLPDGRQAIAHIEAIWSDDPFARMDVLMEKYGIAVAVCEILPNYDEATRFAKRWPGRVFLAHYAATQEDAIVWGDTRLNRSERKTVEEVRTRFTVSLQQYKCMSLSLARFVNTTCLIPDPNALVQTIRDRGIEKLSAIGREMLFPHLMSTALVVEQDELERKPRHKVVKAGSFDPHLSYCCMLADVAYARSWGNSSIFIPEARTSARVQELETMATRNSGMPIEILQMQEESRARLADTCGACISFRKSDGRCTARNFTVQARDPSCELFVRGEFSALDTDLVR